ncbi:uncharacterized protein LOC111326318 [Stylophora pistillata]|uniref:uncharacterized protein LOC111326318 n=1 Tax=Stylophora pistillata TaxID=50429 RepID=UPI000C050ABF|nr:uncharacterized protein LOC111326318 [Stylophora pistillata]
MFIGTPLVNTVAKHYLERTVTASFVRFWPKEWVGRPNMRVELYGCQVYSRSVDFSNLTSMADGYPNFYTCDGSVLTPWHGRLAIHNNSHDGPGSAWCAKSNETNNNQFLQIDLKMTKVIQAIAVQSHLPGDKWVKTFSISSSLDGLFWKQYTEWGNVKVFNGNTHRHSLVKVSIKYNLRARYLRFHPKTWNNHPCLRLEVFAKEDCIDPLGMESGQISDKDITASSALRVNYEPWLARLHSRLGEGGWCAGRSDENQYLEVDLKHPYHVRRVATQGKYSVHGCTIQDAWVTSYMMQFRRDSLDWWNYTENNAIRDFSGNINTTHVVTHHLKNPVIGRYVRFRPINWFRRICMRVEIYGCKACFQPLGMEDFSIPSKNVDSSVASNIYNVRLNYAQRNQFVGGRDKFILQIDLGHFKTVAAVATQGRYRGSHFVRIYRLAFSRLEGEWFYYKENGEVKEIQGNTNADGTVLKILHYQVVARYVRFVAVEWVDNVCLRVEIYGCEAWSDPLGIGSGLISKSKMTSSSTSGPGHEPWLAKLNTVFDTMGWCAAPSDTSPYLQINMGRVVSLTQIAVTGKSGKGMVWKFKFSLSVDGGFWRIYKTVSGEKTFIAATDYSQAFKFSIDLEVKAQFFRFLPEEWTDLPCMNVELYGFDECTMPLGLTEWIIPKEAMTASSSLGTNYAPWMGRLGAMEGGGAWCAKNNDNMQHLQIDLGYVRKVRSLQIQGKEGISRHPTLESAWVKNFTLSHSVDGITWTDHKEDGSLKVFPGNSDPHEARTVVMEVSIIGRHFRIFPKYFHRHICMRLELYGCQACESPLGMENHDIPDYALVASGTYYDPIHARLNKPDYFLLPVKKDEYVQVDTGPGGKSVTAITVRGNFASSNIEWISKFVLNYSRSGCEFFSYMEDGNMKIFQTPSDNRFYATRYRLQHNITARYFRVVLKDWINRPFIQLELYGCEACSKSYGIGNDPLPVSTSSASSSRHGHKPENAQNFTDTCSWCAEQAKGNENLQLDFGKTVVLTGIATKGHHSNDEYVSQFELEYSVDCANWFTYTRSFRLEDTRTQLSANVDNASVRKIGFLYELKARYLKIVAKAWHNGICLRVQVFGYKGCDKDLGMESSLVSNNSINASSYLGEGYEPWNARHNRHHGKGAWCAGQKATDEFIQVQFNQIHVIARVSLQKKEKTSPEDTVGKAWVTKFILAYSEDGVSWSEYSDGSGVKELTGNKIHALANTVRAQFVRIVVKEWYNHICLRMELYGCQACLEPLGVENFHIPDSSFSSSPNYLRLPKRARLGYYKNDMWAARNKNLDQFLQIDLGERKTITAIATQGNSHTYKDSRLREYYIQYSDDSSNWLDYTFEGQQKVFDGYKTQGADIRRKFFPQAIKARYIRLRATKWYDYIATKLEIYGCEA